MECVSTEPRIARPTALKAAGNAQIKNEDNLTVQGDLSFPCTESLLHTLQTHPVFQQLKEIMGDQLTYVRSGDEVLIE